MTDEIRRRSSRLAETDGTKQETQHGKTNVTEYKVADLLIRPREGGYARGHEQLGQILQSAFTTLVEHGYKALTLRRIAADCGMNVGNIGYYFKSKNELVRALLESVMRSYEEAFNVAIAQSDNCPEKQLETLINLVLEDITTKKTTRIFPELWALSNHDPFVQNRLDEAYAIERSYFSKSIKQLNVDLPDDECEIAALFISASLEGMTIFAGFEKEWQSSMPTLQRLARACFVDLVKKLKPGDASNLRIESSKTHPLARQPRRANVSSVETRIRQSKQRSLGLNAKEAK